MKIVLNGAEASVDEPCNVERLLVLHELADAPCAVEVNRELVPRANRVDHELREGDVIEIVTLVGGG